MERPPPTALATLVRAALAEHARQDACAGGGRRRAPCARPRDARCRMRPPTGRAASIANARHAQRPRCTLRTEADSGVGRPDAGSCMHRGQRATASLVDQARVTQAQADVYATQVAELQRQTDAKYAHARAPRPRLRRHGRQSVLTEATSRDGRRLRARARAAVNAKLIEARAAREQVRLVRVGFAPSKHGQLMRPRGSVRCYPF